MTKIKLCGLSRPEDIEAANSIGPDYIGFVFARRSSRHVTPEQAASLKRLLDGSIRAVGVFVDERPEQVANLLESGVIDLAQLHGSEDEDYIAALRRLTRKPLIRAFRIRSGADLAEALTCPADHILLDSGAGSGQMLDWAKVAAFPRPYFLAGGLTPENAGDAIDALHPYALDVSSGIETGGLKDPGKMIRFVKNVRERDMI